MRRSKEREKSAVRFVVWLVQAGWKQRGWKNLFIPEYTRVQEEASPPGDVANHVVYTVSVNFPPFPRKHN